MKIGICCIQKYNSIFRVDANFIYEKSRMRKGGRMLNGRFRQEHFLFGVSIVLIVLIVKPLSLYFISFIMIIFTGSGLKG